MKIYCQAGRRFSKAFSLMEILAVMVIIALVTSLSLFAFGNVMGSTRISLATQKVMDELNSARAAALARNLPVEVCFLQVSDDSGNGGSSYRMVQTRVLGADGSLTWIAKPQVLPPSVVVLPSATLSNAIGTQNPVPIPNAVGGADGVAIRIYPSGRVERTDDRAVPLPPGNEQLLVTLGFERDRNSDARNLPPNFATIQINPRNSRMEIFRP